MASSSANCSACGRTLASNRLRGLCPSCLVRGITLDGEAEHEPGDENGKLFSIPGHDVLDELARGGMGIVYRARQRDPEREVALKMLLPGGSTPVLRERFRNEARTMAELDHPGVLPLYNFGEHGGTPWFTMRLASGGSLADHLKNPGDPLRTDSRKAAALTAEIADAVAYAHQRGVLHRDLKPANILFHSDGRASVADFGLAKLDSVRNGLTVSRAMLGTPHNLAPELAAKPGAAATVATDVYALGTILYEMLAGRPPFQAETLPGLLRSIVEDDPPSLLNARSNSDGSRISPGLAAIVGKAMSKQASRRYRDATALAADLRAWLAGEAIEARPPSKLEKVMRWGRRYPAAATSLVLVVLSTAAVVLLQMKWGRELRAEKSAAELSEARARGSQADALAAQVAAARAGGRLDSRNAALAAAKEAAKLKVTEPLRNDTITLLVTPGWEALGTWNAGFCETMPLAPDHDVFAVISSGKLLLHDLTGKAPSQTSPPAPAGLLTVCRVTTGGRFVLARSRKGICQLYDRAANKWVRQWSEPAWGITLSNDERWLAWSSKVTGEIVVENFRTGKEWRRFKCELPQPVPLAFDPDVIRLLVSGDKASKLDILELASGKVIGSLPTLGTGGRAQAAWRFDGKAVCLAMNVPDLYVCTLDDNAVVQDRVVGHQSEAVGVAWHPDGRWFVSCGVDRTVRVWESLTRREVMRVPILASSVQFNRDGTELACHAAGSGQLHRFAFRPPACVLQFALPRHHSADNSVQRPPWGCALSPDGRLGLTSCDFGLLYFDALTGRRLGTQRGMTPSDLLFNDTGDTIFMSGSDGMRPIPVKRIAALGYELVLPHAHRPHLTNDTVFRMGWSNARRRLVLSLKSGVAYLDRPGESGQGSLQTLPGAPFEVNPVAISPDGRWVVASAGESRGDAMLIWDMDNIGKPLVLKGYSKYTYIRFSPDSRTLYANSKAALRALTAGTWKTKWEQPHYGVDEVIHLMTISGDGRLIATAEPPAGIGLYDAETGHQHAVVHHPDARFTGWIALDHAATRMAVTTLPDSVLIWDLRELRRELAELGLDWNAPACPPAPPEVKLRFKFLPVLPSLPDLPW